MGIINRIATSEFFQRSGLARGLTNLMGHLADCRVPGPVLRFVIRKYISTQRVNMDLYNNELNSYRTFNQFFTRQFIPESRSFAEGIVSPAEGIVTSAGIIENRQLFHVKGSYYPLEALLHKEEQGFAGSFATIYLSPADYHRFHAPFNCNITSIKHLHGRVQTVNPDIIRKDPLIFCNNERVILEGLSDYGRFFMVVIGAIVVGRIKLTIKEDMQKGFSEEGLSISLNRGDEIGMFELGSTVILIMAGDHLREAKELAGRHVKLGESLVQQ